MARQLHKALVRYYYELRVVYDEWLQFRKQVEESVTTIVNQKEMRLLIQEASNDKEMEEIHHRVMFDMLMALDEEYNNLYKIMSRFNSKIQDLSNCWHNVAQIRSKVSLVDQEIILLIEGSPYRPTLDSLLLEAYRSCEYFKKMYHCIHDKIALSQPIKVQPLNEILNAINECDRMISHIDNILAETQFMVNEDFSQAKCKDTGT